MSFCTNLNHLSSLCFIFVCCFLRLPEGVLQSQFGSVSKVLVDTLRQYESTDSTSLLKSVSISLLSSPLSLSSLPLLF